MHFQKFQRLVFNRLSFYLESENHFCSSQASFWPGKSSLDQTPLLSQSNRYGFQKKRPPDWIVLATITFLKLSIRSGIQHSIINFSLYVYLLTSFSRPFPSCQTTVKVLFRGARSPFNIRHEVSQRSFLKAQPFLFYLFITLLGLASRNLVLFLRPIKSCKRRPKSP